MKRVKVLDAYVDNLDLNEIIAVIKGFIRSHEPHRVITINSLMVSYLGGDDRLKDILRGADLVVADSVGIVWAAGYLGNPGLQRIAGIDLMLEICALAAKEEYCIYLLGAHDSIVRKAAENLQNKFPSLKIAGVRHGYFNSTEEKEIINEIKEFRPDVLFVGMDMHRQEKWIEKHINELGVPVCMGIGGSFDVISNRLKRAPLWARKIGLEWVYRFLLQPWRIIRLIKLPLFVFKVFRQKHS